MAIIRIRAEEMKDKNGKPATGDSLFNTAQLVRAHSIKGAALQQVSIHDTTGKSWDFYTDNADEIIHRLDRE